MSRSNARDTKGHIVGGTVGQPGTRITYCSRSDATTESELRALRSVYAYVLMCHQRKACAVSAGKTQAREEKVNAAGCAGVVT